jgi:chemotaxis protein MotB
MSEALSQVFSGPGGPKGANPALEGGSGFLEGGQSLSDEPAVLVVPADVEETQQLQGLRAQFETDFSDQIQAGEVEVSGTDLWFAIELRSSLLFESGGAVPAIAADAILAQVADRLKGLDNPIHVEGFTDNEPIATEQYPSNWELSAARAAAVVRLLAMNGVDPRRMAAVGYGEYQPAYSNRTAEGRRLNRRIVIVVSRDEKVRRAVSAFGSDQVSEDAVNAMLIDQGREEDAPPTLEQVETEDGILFRQARPEQQQE